MSTVRLTVTGPASPGSDPETLLICGLTVAAVPAPILEALTTGRAEATVTIVWESGTLWRLDETTTVGLRAAVPPAHTATGATPGHSPRATPVTREAMGQVEAVQQLPSRAFAGLAAHGAATRPAASARPVAKAPPGASSRTISHQPRAAAGGIDASRRPSILGNSGAGAAQTSTSPASSLDDINRKLADLSRGDLPETEFPF